MLELGDSHSDIVIRESTLAIGAGLWIGVGGLWFSDSDSSGVDGDGPERVVLWSKFSVWFCVVLLKSCSGDGKGVCSELPKINDSLSLFSGVGDAGIVFFQKWKISWQQVSVWW